MFWCPTSEFPICLSGKPTASPEVLIAVCGQFFANLSRLGVRARAIALPSLRGLIPQPSIIINTNGRSRPVGDVLIMQALPMCIATFLKVAASGYDDDYVDE